MTGCPRSRRHLDFFQYEAWLHAEVTGVVCACCGKTTQVSVPWAREGGGFTLLFEALALTMCQDLPVRQAARDLRVRDKQLWRRIEHCVSEALEKQDMSRVRIVRIDETCLRRGHDYVTLRSIKKLSFELAPSQWQTIEWREGTNFTLRSCLAASSCAPSIASICEISQVVPSAKLTRCKPLYSLAGVPP